MSSKAGITGNTKMMRWDKRNKIKGVGWGKEVQACDGQDEKFGTVGRWHLKRGVT